MQTRRLIAMLATSWLIASSPAFAQSGEAAPKAPPTASDMYVSCYLYVRGTSTSLGADGFRRVVDPNTCQAVALLAIAKREGIAQDEYSFCLPDDAATRADAIKPMAYAYLDWFEHIGSQMAGANGPAAFVVAQHMKWPCASAAK